MIGFNSGLKQAKKNGNLNGTDEILNISTTKTFVKLKTNNKTSQRSKISYRGIKFYLPGSRMPTKTGFDHGTAASTTVMLEVWLMAFRGFLTMTKCHEIP